MNEKIWPLEWPRLKPSSKQKVLNAVREMTAELRVQCLEPHVIRFFDKRLHIIRKIMEGSDG